METKYFCPYCLNRHEFEKDNTITHLNHQSQQNSYYLRKYFFISCKKCKSKVKAFGLISYNLLSIIKNEKNK